jgi:mannose-6-phosphate isomerase-like protein (cupin superfamily)
MIIKNFLTAKLEDLANCHDGEGVLKHISLYGSSDFKTKLEFLNYTILPSGTTIGIHQHGDNEELYIVLEGNGVMTVDGESRDVCAGDVIVNKPFGSHGIINNSNQDLKLLVFEAGN